MVTETAKALAEETLSLVVPFCDAAKDRAIDLLRESHAGCVDGLNKGDIGSGHRLALVKGLPGLPLPAGHVVAEPSGTVRPVNVTWLNIPTERGSLFAAVNCVRFHGSHSDVYRLTRGDVSDLGDFAPNATLLDVPIDGDLQLLLGFRWTYRAKDRSMSFLLRLLCGKLDCDRRLFHAYAERDVAKLDTRVDEVRRGVSTEAKGPEPELRPKKKRTED